MTTTEKQFYPDYDYKYVDNLKTTFYDGDVVLYEDCEEEFTIVNGYELKYDEDEYTTIGFLTNNKKQMAYFDVSGSTLGFNNAYDWYFNSFMIDEGSTSTKATVINPMIQQFLGEYLFAYDESGNFYGLSFDKNVEYTHQTSPSGYGYDCFIDYNKLCIVELGTLEAPKYTNSAFIETYTRSHDLNGIELSEPILDTYYSEDVVFEYNGATLSQKYQGLTAAELETKIPRLTLDFIGTQYDKYGVDKVDPSVNLVQDDYTIGVEGFAQTYEEGCLSARVVLNSNFVWESDYSFVFERGIIEGCEIEYNEVTGLYSKSDFTLEAFDTFDELLDENVPNDVFDDLEVESTHYRVVNNNTTFVITIDVTIEYEGLTGARHSEGAVTISLPQ